MPRKIEVLVYGVPLKYSRRKGYAELVIDEDTFIYLTKKEYNSLVSQVVHAMEDE